MAYMLFEDEKNCRNAIEEMLDKCDIIELNNFLEVLLKHFYPFLRDKRRPL